MLLIQPLASLARAVSPENVARPRRR